METIHESTNQGKPYDENLGPIPSFGNIGAPYMEMLFLPRFTIGFPIWLFSTPMVPNVQTTSHPSSPPLEQYQPLVDPKLESSPSSSLSGEILQVSNQVDKKKKKRKIKKNKNKQWDKQAIIVMDTTNPAKLYSLACYVRVTTFLEIVLVFIKY